MFNKIVVIVILLIACLSPTWIWLAATYIFSPIGFWQNFVMLGLGVYVLGGLQILLLVGWGTLVPVILDQP